MMARDRERYRLEDRELEIKMAEQGIRCEMVSQSVSIIIIFTISRLN